MSWKMRWMSRMMGAICIPTRTSYKDIIMSDIVTHRFTDDHYFPPAHSFCQLRIALSPVYQSISQSSQLPSPHLSSHLGASWHRVLIIRMMLSSQTDLTISIDPVTSISDPRDGIAVQNWDPEAWLATQPQRTRDLHIPLPAIIMDENGV